GAKPETTIMIGDNPETDIMGALAAGMDAIFFNPKRKETPVSASVTHEVHTLKEIMDIL
ncbi:MAG: HAD hydrolase-like protein, partial [Bacteroidaceae bacterium]|nr:HAD hydrolase-like protein [Bacteroidaceae bacterium]